MGYHICGAGVGKTLLVPGGFAIARVLRIINKSLRRRLGVFRYFHLEACDFSLSSTDGSDWISAGCGATARFPNPLFDLAI
jgi:hypothetical protein